MENLSSVPTGKLIHLSELKDLSETYQLWNKEYHQIYPITDELFKRNLCGLDDQSSFAWIVDDQLVGFIIGKIYTEGYIDKYTNLGWISLFYVSPRYRGQGIGTILINSCLNSFKAQGKIQVNLGADYNNYFPGLPIDLQVFRQFFLNKGFTLTYMTFDLMAEPKGELLPIKNPDFNFRIGNKDDKDAILAFINKCWPGRWHKEALDYFAAGGDGSHYMLGFNEQNQIIAFAKVCNPATPENQISFSLTWRARFDSLGGIGPLGVDPDYRKRHLGYDVVAHAYNYLVKCNTSKIIIDWTGLLEFYRHMGFEVWKSYFYFNIKF